MNNLQSNWLNILLPSAISFAAGYGLHAYLSKQNESNEPEDDEPVDEDEDEEYDSEEDNSNIEIDEENHYKMVLVARQDLGMTKGKLAAQVGHAVLGAYRSARRNNLLAFNSWEYGGGAKVVVKANSEQELLDLHKKAKEAGVNCHLVVDAGRTQIPSGSRTVLAIGPDTDAKVDPLTRHLKLM